MKGQLENKMLQSELNSMEIENRRIDEVIDQFVNINERLTNKLYSGSIESRYKIAAMIQKNHILKTGLSNLDDVIVGVIVQLEDLVELQSKKKK